MNIYWDKDLNRSLWPSEVLWQCYELACETKEEHSASNLKFVIRNCVVNESSRIAIWQAARMSTTAAEGPNGYGMYTNIDDGFFAMLSSPNGASTLRMLIDHKEQIKYRTVKRIVVFGCRDIEDVEDDRKSRTYMLALSDPRKLS